ncbi:cobalt ECF transporter T component CbiQ [Virgibacillus sp. NKC19-16]|uniref:cobalt ECF transporter T component CbiQ n=1 Tax=Virgibacillus salidurans TaxID=2831673 RepID=UPI001F31DEFB|nr:cobalt ECF transporter T component CbiQ [Virgibacillus sp. NKC19-16]UJL45252.1 cobalt ECF transporter T component CbiQ [Virgibacillus sp. NKC19-16]
MVNNSGDGALEISQWALDWEPRAKLVAGLFFIFGVISLTTTAIATIAYVTSFMIVVFMRIPLTLLFKRYLIITPFLLLMTVPLLFGQGFFVSDNLAFATLILIKAFTSMNVITIILDSQSLDQFMNSLADLKVPPLLITVLILSYRYVFLFLDDIQKMQIAMKSRFFNGGLSIRALKVYGQLIGTLIIRSMDRAERMYEAMASRCFNGKLRFEKSPKMTQWDFFKTAAAVVIIVGLIIVERGYVV